MKLWIKKAFINMFLIVIVFPFMVIETIYNGIIEIIKSIYENTIEIFEYWE